MGSNSAKSSNDFSSETTGQVWINVGYNDHLVMENRIYTWKEYYNDSGTKLLKHVQKHDVQVTVKALGPLVCLQKQSILCIKYFQNFFPSTLLYKKHDVQVTIKALGTLVFLQK